VTRWWKWIGLALASLLAVAAFGALAVATQSKSQAHSSLEDAIRLREARLDVAKAQKALGGSNIQDAARSGQKANAVALRVGALTERIVTLLRPLSGSTKEAVDQGRRGIRNSVVARKQTETAAGILGAIAGYQSAAVDDAALTNRALRRILTALRETNESIP
jgi:predicted ATPase